MDQTPRRTYREGFAMPHFNHGNGSASEPNGNKNLDQPWFAFFQRIKAMAETLDEIEAADTELVEN